MEIVGWKVVSIFSLLIVALFGVFLPILIRVELVCLDAFAAGVILVVAVMHLQTEAEEAFNHLGGDAHTMRGYAGAISVVTFILMIIIQELTIKFFAPAPAQKVDHSPNVPNAPAETQKPTYDQDEKEPEKEPVEDASVDAHLHIECGEIANAERSHPKNDNSSSSCALLSISPCGHHHGGNIDDDVENTTSNVVGTLCFFVALGVHCVLEGVALGVNGCTQSFQITFWSIFAHKGLAGFALGKTLLHAKISWTIYSVVSTLFAIFTPLGIGIGWISTIENPANSVGGAIATAIAAGTFLSVATYELIPDLFMKPGKIVEKLVGITLGSGIMILLLLFVGHEHHDHHDHSH